MEFLFCCIAGFLIAEIIIRLLKIAFIDNGLPFSRKLHTWFILSVGGIPKEYSNHFIRLGQFATLAAMQQQLELIENKPDADYRKFVKKFVDLNIEIVNSEDSNVSEHGFSFVKDNDINNSQ